MIASQKGHVEAVRLLVARQDVEVNKSAADGYTALILASVTSRWCGSGERARQGVEVNNTTQDGATALYVASQNGHVEVVQLLLARQGVEVNKTTQSGTTALIIATAKGHVERKILISRFDALVRDAGVSDAFALLFSGQRLEEFKLAQARVRRGSRCDTTARSRRTAY
jgi:ankyrin repeat protein